MSGGEAVLLSGWGRFPKAWVHRQEAKSAGDVTAAIASEKSLIARGNGRAYGDSALNPALTLSMLLRRRILDFDAATGRITCQAGVLLADVIETVLPRGWFVAVTPGTKFATIGGLIAVDAHGKNHHGAGSFCDHVESMTIALAEGRVVRCSATEEPALFAATRGGMGLTGVILDATLWLIPVETALIRQETIRAADLAEVMALFEASQHWTYTVAWIDCLARGAALGRSLLFRGEHLRQAELPAGWQGDPLAAPVRWVRRVPVDFPGWVLNRWSVRAFNELYYRRGKPGSAVVDYDAYFYPLDALLEWNRIYGKPGFVQYQCVLPKSASEAGLTALLRRIGAAGAGSFLAVLKLFGAQRGTLSFPMEGYTLALDFRATPAVLALLEELDAIVADHGGRLYLAKDARMGARIFRLSYPALETFVAERRAIGGGKFSSLQSQRLEI